MADIQVRVTGADEAAAAFRRLADAARRLDLGDMGDEVRGALVGNSPRLTGALAESWDVAPGSGHVSIGSDLVYASVQNYGGYHGITGLHFVERAAELATDKSGAIVSNEMDRLISRL